MVLKGYTFTENLTIRFVKISTEEGGAGTTFLMKTIILSESVLFFVKTDKLEHAVWPKETYQKQNMHLHNFKKRKM